MTIKVKSGFCEKLFLNASGQLVAVLRSQKLFGPEKAIVGPDKTIEYETDIESLPDKPAGKNRRYLLKQGGVVMATAQPVYSADADHFAITRLPRPIGLSILMQNGTQWRVARGEKNDVELYAPEGLGKLSEFFSIRPQVFEIPDGSDIFLWAGVYTLVGYMMHEDDRYPV